MTKLEYVKHEVCEGDADRYGSDEDIMISCPSEYFMPKGDICNGKHESKDCKACWNAEKPQEEA